MGIASYVRWLTLPAALFVSLVGCREPDESRPLPVPIASGAAGAGGAPVEEPIVCEPADLVKFASPAGAGRPPGPPPAAPSGDGSPSQYAVRGYFLGDTTFDGARTAQAWKLIGFDLDGFRSSKDFGCHCKSVTKAAKADIRTDGENGIDNAFGNIIISQQTVPIADASQSASDGVERGLGALVIAFSDLGPSPSYGSVKAQIIPVRMPTGVTPGFTVADAWAPFTGTTMPAVAFDGGWVTDDTWVSAPSEDTLEVVLLGTKLSIRKPTITAKLSRDHTHIDRGIIGGFLETETFIEALRDPFGARNVCGDGFTSVAEQVRAASDTPSGGAHDPAVPCNAISIGLGFTAALTGPLGPPLDPEPAPRTCGE